jgi:hypothetical protein
MCLFSPDYMDIQSLGGKPERGNINVARGEEED